MAGLHFVQLPISFGPEYRLLSDSQRFMSQHMSGLVPFGSTHSKSTKTYYECVLRMALLALGRWSITVPGPRLARPLAAHLCNELLIDPLPVASLWEGLETRTSSDSQTSALMAPH